METAKKAIVVSLAVVGAVTVAVTVALFSISADLNKGWYKYKN